MKGVNVQIMGQNLTVASDGGDITFRGFNIECCEGYAVVMTEPKDCLVAGCVIRNVGDYHGSAVLINGG